jgi:hypothetical protein
LENKMLTLDHSLKKVMAKRIGEGLKRRTITSCSRWSESYRVMGQPFPGLWKFDHHPWSREMHDCEAELMVGQKAAQMAYTETALNKTFYKMDVKGLSVMYVLPASKPDASDFSTSRFDPALELSPHLENMFSNVKNVGHKRAGSANLFIRGSRSRSQLKSVPVAEMIFDEVDEMVQENIPLAFERTSGQAEGDVQIFLLSTPTIDKYGINSYFIDSTQEHYFFKCPHCSRLTELVAECLIITAETISDPNIRNTHLICKECKAVLDHQDKVNFLKDIPAGGSAVWVPQKTDQLARGFQINQLYSMVMPPYKIAISKIKAETNPADEQEYWNSKMGECHTVEGAKISDTQLAECVHGYTKMSSCPTDTLVTMGVDVGKWLHIEITQWFFEKGAVPSVDVNLMATGRLVWEGKRKDFEELDGLMHQFKVNFCVIDANPERRKALEFAQRFWGYVRMCIYGNGVNGKQINVHADAEHMVTVDRTSWLDLSLGRIKRQALHLPKDLSLEYKDHLKAPVRVYRKDKNDNPVGTYVTGNEADHFAHARNYCEIALPLAAGLMTSQDIKGVV